MNSDHYLDALNHGFMQFSRQAGKTAATLKALEEQMQKITGMEITGVWIDELEDILDPKVAELRQLAADKTQSELEAVPGFATF